MRKVRLLFLTVGIFSSLVSISQSVTPFILNVTGGTNMLTFYRFEWSFGEAIAIETMTTPNLQVTNGLLQPGTEFPASVNNASAWGPDEIKIFPNPTRDILEIDFFSKQKGRVVMNLYDQSGRFMISKEFDYYGAGSIQKMSFALYASGSYFLNIQLAPTGNSVAKKGTYQVQKMR